MFREDISNEMYSRVGCLGLMCAPQQVDRLRLYVCTDRDLALQRGAGRDPSAGTETVTVTESVSVRHSEGASLQCCRALGGVAVAAE
jgi:hypothetical protein